MQHNSSLRPIVQSAALIVIPLVWAAAPVQGQSLERDQSYLDADASETTVANQAGTCSFEWSRVGNGMNGPVRTLSVLDDGTGTKLYAGGSFTVVGGNFVNSVATWDGVSWSALGSGTNGSVLALTVFDDGTGPALYAGGTFTTAGGVLVNHIAKWNGSSWSALGSGTNGDVHALAVFDDGGGSALYVGGTFTTAGGASRRYIAKWNGSTWSALGNSVSDSVFALSVFDDGGGPDLYAGGDFTFAGDTYVLHAAQWDGSAWFAMANGRTSPVLTMARSDNEGEAALYVGGPDSVSKWNGTSWSGVNGGVECTGFRCETVVHALATFDDGIGSGLYVGGKFSIAGGTSANNIAKFDGSTWSALGTGVSICGGVSCSPVVYSLAVFDEGTGSGLYVGGSFLSAGGVSVNNIARWACTPTPRPGDCDGDRILSLSDYGDYFHNDCFLGPGMLSATGDLPEECECADLDQDGDADLNDFRAYQIQLGT